MKDPNFRVNSLLLGAGRSGTTSLCTALSQHPEICFSTIKEVNYFSIENLYSRGEDYFHSLFECQGEKVVATSDTYLLPTYRAIRKIHAYNPKMKLIALLRDPVSRAYSSYNYSTNYGHHEKYDSFIDSLKVEQQITDEPDVVRLNNLAHFYCSLYGKHLLKWAEFFGKEQLLILRTADMVENPDKLADQITKFLEIGDFPFYIEKQNVNAVPKSKFLERLMINRNSILRKSIRNLLPWGMKQKIFKSGLVDKLRSANRSATEAPKLSDQEHKQAREFFRDDLEILRKEFGIIL